MKVESAEYSLKVPTAVAKIAEWLPLLTKQEVELINCMRSELGFRSNISPVLDQWVVKDEIAAKDAIDELRKL